MKAMIVEDESVIRNGLAACIPWKQLGINEVRMAEHGDEAIKICQNFKPDIIVSDICMPGINGVELCRRIREDDPNVQIIFVTGHAEKEYLKAAIDLHAVCYVEKPVNVNELFRAVSKAVEEVKKSKSYLATMLHTLLKNPQRIDYSVSADPVYAVFVMAFRPVLHEVQKDKLLKRIELLANRSSRKIWGDVLDTGEMAVIISGSKAVVEDKCLMAELKTVFYQYLAEEGIKGFLAIGKDVYGQEMITESYRSARKAMECLGFLDWNHCACEADHPGESKGKLFGDYTLFRELIARKDTAKAREILQNMYEEILNNKSVIDGDIRLTYYNLNRIIESARYAYADAENRISAGDDTDSPKIGDMRTLRELHEYICQKLVTDTSSETEEGSNLMIQKVKDYIHAHYEDSSLSIKILADYVGLTPTYLSNLYKKKTEKTVGQYVLEVRMEAAKRMLRDPQYKLYQVSANVGYEDANYFTKIFKKETGMTPSEYRNKMVI